MTPWSKVANALLRGIAWLAGGAFWLSPVLLVVGFLAILAASATITGEADMSSREKFLLAGAFWIVGVWAIVASIALLIPWLRHRSTLANLGRVWRPRQETWKQLYVAGQIPSSDYLHLAETTEDLLSGKNPAWLARHVGRVARGIAVAMLLGGIVALLVGTLFPPSQSGRCSELCVAFPAVAVSIGALAVPFGIALFAAGLVSSVSGRVVLQQTLQELSRQEARVMAAANERNTPPQANASRKKAKAGMEAIRGNRKAA